MAPRSSTASHKAARAVAAAAPVKSLATTTPCTRSCIAFTRAGVNSRIITLRWSRCSGGSIKMIIFIGTGIAHAIDYWDSLLMFGSKERAAAVAY